MNEEFAPTLRNKLDHFNRELAQLQHFLTSWQEELSIREAQILKEHATIKKQREELIQKSNLIVEQVTGLRKEKEQVAQKMREAETLKQSAIEQLEKAETLMAEIRLKEKESVA